MRRCPTGALHYRLWAGDPEEPARPTTITRDPAGPLLVRGDLHLDTPDGARDETRAALCGCGQTSTQPFCDGACGVNQQHPGGTRDPGPGSGKEPLTGPGAAETATHSTGYLLPGDSLR